MATHAATAAELTFSPHNAVVAGPDARPSRLTVQPGVPAEGIVVSSSGAVAATDFQWVLLGLTVPANTTITGIKVYYQAVGGGQISQIRLTKMTTPDFASVVEDYQVALWSTSPTVFRSPTFKLVTGGVMTLALKIVLPLGGRVNLGSVSLLTSP